MNKYCKNCSSPAGTICQRTTCPAKIAWGDDVAAGYRQNMIDSLSKPPFWKDMRDPEVGTAPKPHIFTVLDVLNGNSAKKEPQNAVSELVT